MAYGNGRNQQSGGGTLGTWDDLNSFGFSNSQYNKSVNSDGSYSSSYTPDLSKMNTGGNSFGLADGISAGLGGLQALGGLANTFLGFQNYRLAKKQFGFEKAAYNRNLSNQAQLINNQIDAAANISAQLGYNPTASSASNQASRQQIMDNANKTKVDGSKI